MRVELPGIGPVWFQNSLGLPNTKDCRTCLYTTNWDYRRVSGYDHRHYVLYELTPHNRVNIMAERSLFKTYVDKYVLVSMEGAIPGSSRSLSERFIAFGFVDFDAAFKFKLSFTP